MAGFLVQDGHFVPNLTLGAPIVQSLRKHTNAFLDCHLMVSNPKQWVQVRTWTAFSVRPWGDETGLGGSRQGARPHHRLYSGVAASGNRQRSRQHSRCLPAARHRTLPRPARTCTLSTWRLLQQRACRRARRHPSCPPPRQTQPSWSCARRCACRYVTRRAVLVPGVRQAVLLATARLPTPRCGGAAAWPPAIPHRPAAGPLRAPPIALLPV